jgi:hypothetical protein
VKGEMSRERDHHDDSDEHHSFMDFGAQTDGNHQEIAFVVAPGGFPSTSVRSGFAVALVRFDDPVALFQVPHVFAHSAHVSLDGRR